MLVSAIVATDQNGLIGDQGQIPWYLPADLKYFKRTTLHHHLIMGRKTFASIGRPLPRRHTIILTRDPFYAVSGAQVAHHIPEALSLAYEAGETEAFIAGGGEIYKQSIDLWDRVYLTRIQTEATGDTYFPELDPSEWTCTSEREGTVDEKNPHPHRFLIYERKSAS